MKLFMLGVVTGIGVVAIPVAAYLASVLRALDEATGWR